MLVKPPFMGEIDALEWAQRSIDFAFGCGADVVSLLPVRLGNGALESLAALGLFSGRARADLTITGQKTPTQQPQPQPPTHVMQGGVVARPPEPVLMGKIKMPESPKPPKKPEVKMGELPLMGDIAIDSTKK